MKIGDAIQGIDAALLFIDGKHCVQWMNARAEEWFGRDILGGQRLCYRTRSYGPIFCSICPTGKVMECGGAAHYEFTLPGQKNRNFEVIAVPVRDGGDGPSSVVEIVIDVTDRGVVKLKEHELMVQIEKMAAVGQLAAGVAHELNTPLGTISIISNEIARLVEGAGSGSVPAGALAEYIEDMRGEIARCKTIIKDLLDFSKAGATSYVFSDINALVSKTVDFIVKGPVSSAVRVTRTLDPALPAVRTDPDRFRQVVFNVVRNAVEAVEENGGGTVDVRTRAENGLVRVSVKDDGPGISEESLKRVFDPFYTTKPVGKGTGLGLSVSYGIMRDLKGEIRITSVSGAGAEAIMTLPAV